MAKTRKYCHARGFTKKDGRSRRLSFKVKRLKSNDESACGVKTQFLPALQMS